MICLRSSVQDKGNNRTRFICISRNLEIYPGSDKTSIMMVLNHKPGALYKVLARLLHAGHQRHEAGIPPHSRPGI